MEPCKTSSGQKISFSLVFSNLACFLLYMAKMQSLIQTACILYTVKHHNEKLAHTLQHCKPFLLCPHTSKRASCNDYKPIVVKNGKRIFQYNCSISNQTQQSSWKVSIKKWSGIKGEYNHCSTSHSNVIAHCAELNPPPPSLLRLDLEQKLKMAVSSAVRCEAETSVASWLYVRSIRLQQHPVQ